MWAESIQDKLEAIAERVLGAEGLELVEAKVHLKGRHRTITFFIDRPDSGVSIGDCARVSRLLEDEFDQEDLIEGRYLLEVSSPGLDRPLAVEKDFVRFRGQRAKVTTRNAVMKQNFFVGLLGEIQEGQLTLELDSGDRVRIPLDEISMARLEVIP